jgi:hypothetical protein
MDRIEASPPRSDIKYSISASISTTARDHGGVNFSEINFTEAQPDPQFDVANFHDAILAETIYLVGGGVGYQLNNDLGVSLSGRLFVAGANTQNASVIALGVTWSPL